MYAVIATGGKQDGSPKASRSQVELLDADEGDEVTLTARAARRRRHRARHARPARRAPR